VAPFSFEEDAMRKGLRKYSRYIRYDDKIFRNVGLKDDGSLYNPNNYPEDKARAAIAYEAERIARQAAATRQRRYQQRIHSIAKQILEADGIGERHCCALCKKALTDPTSVKRGIGPECWDHVMRAVKRQKIESGAAA
jgi:Family of unknown function (DUF6011)